ncbi:hypothetical protein HF086_008793 [Spodoptera exigua]|uniref:Retrotransposon gag domain-containing protein n=1 Tax=Spodoptera exigua TaxID=7107 RepID=A0A922MYW3_SPOEX|nr:hypothetical protein HF086_008793 [Spodoptera exigua]
MKNNLLTKQSATALQLELLQSRQGSQSIEEFGKKLEDLFVELTISQADGKEDAYKMFRPVNEKLAIQRFTEGLRNGRLSTILTARDYSELKDVIRAAKDEERRTKVTAHRRRQSLRLSIEVDTATASEESGTC